MRFVETANSVTEQNVPVSAAFVQACQAAMRSTRLQTRLGAERPTARLGAARASVRLTPAVAKPPPSEQQLPLCDVLTFVRTASAGSSR